MLRLLQPQFITRTGVPSLVRVGELIIGTNPVSVFTPIRHRTSAPAPRPSTRDSYSQAQTPRGKVNTITVPVRLQKRLEQKMIKDSTKSAIKRRMVEASRKGSTKIVLSARNHELNHYWGQSYQEIPLVSKGWAHRKAGMVHDFFKIHAHGENASLPSNEDQTKTTFSDLGLSSNIVQVLDQTGIRVPTVIQAAAIPKLLKRLNCLVSAETGCGKTLTYLLPLIQQILETKRRRNYKESINAPLALILVPTRELATQVANVAEDLAAHFDLKVKLVQGGNIGSKIKSPPSAYIDLMVSTVRVISELTRVHVYSMSRLLALILDEADTMTDDSFCDEVMNFLKPFPFVGENKIQLGLVCATMPLTLDTILADKLGFASLLPITTPGLHMIMNHVPQTFLRVKKSEKPSKILELLKKDEKEGISTIVFCNRQETCYWLFKYLSENQINCNTLIGLSYPRERKERLNSYLNQDVPVMISTDLGSRGLNTLQTAHIINYDFPAYIADYVHRCGRTGRVGCSVKGRVTNLIAWPGEVKLVQRIEISVRKETNYRTIDPNIKRRLTSKYGYGINQPILPMSDDDDDQLTEKGN